MKIFRMDTDILFQPTGLIPCPACGKNDAQILTIGSKPGLLAVRCYPGLIFHGCGHRGPDVRRGEAGGPHKDRSLADQRWNAAT